jgi:hypothetical protein
MGGFDDVLRLYCMLATLRLHGVELDRVSRFRLALVERILDFPRR